MNGTADPSLRSLAERHRLLIGAAVAMEPLRHDPRYRDVLVREYNQVTAENVMKPHRIFTARDTADFSAADELIRFAGEHRMKVRGHTLLWHEAIPAWLRDPPLPPAEFRRIIAGQIQQSAAHFRGGVFCWDVVNEAVESDDVPLRPLYRDILGRPFLAEAFHLARAADPDARLFYNETGAHEMNGKSNFVHQLLKDLLDGGAPVDGVGLQCHLRGDRPLNVQAMRANIRRLRDLGLAVHFTEVDIRILLPVTPEKLTTQADLYRKMIELALSEKVECFTTWGFTDASSWIPTAKKGYGAALPFDEACQPKPAYHAIVEALS